MHVTQNPLQNTFRKRTRIISLVLAMVQIYVSRAFRIYKFGARTRIGEERLKLSVPAREPGEYIDARSSIWCGEIGRNRLIIAHGCTIFALQWTGDCWSRQRGENLARLNVRVNGVYGMMGRVAVFNYILSVTIPQN